MIHFLTRMASLVLAFGFFISCSTTSPSVDTDTNTSENLSEAQIKKRLKVVSKKIAAGDHSTDLLYQKGLLLTELARKKGNPTDRTIIYSDAHVALNKASQLYSDSLNNADKEKAEELLKVTWSNEHNQGVQIMQGDSTLDSSGYQRAAAHFNNATVIIPDSSISYKMEARAHYRNKEYERAIQVLEKAREAIDQPPVPMLEQLAFLYLETDQPEKAVKIYEQANSFSDQNLNLIHGLSNAYISAGQHQQAIDLLRVLLENKPKNIIYGQSLATELYLFAAEKLESFVSDLRESAVFDSTAYHSADSLFQQAENEFERLLNDYPEDLNLKLNTAHFYQNSSAKYQKMLPLISRQDKQAEISSRIEQYLSSAIPLLEQLTKHQPDEKGIWKNLYQAYTYLGMEEKAREAKANF